MTNQAKVIQFNQSKGKTFDDFVLSLQVEGKSPLTIRQYKSSFNRFAKWFKGDPNEAIQSDIADFKRYMVEGDETTDPMSPNTQRQTLTHLKAFFNYMGREGQSLDNPVERIEAVKYARDTPKWLDKRQQDDLRRKVNRYGNIREAAIIELMLGAGLRVQEVCDLIRNDVTISERKGEVRIRDGKHGKARIVPLNKDVRRILSEYMEANEAAGSSPLFVSTSNNARGKAVSTRSVQMIVEKYRKLTEIDGLTCHALRHSFGHDLVTKDVPLNQVAKLLGHMKSNGLPNIEMTLIYTQPSQDDLQNAVERLSIT